MWPFSRAQTWRISYTLRGAPGRGGFRQFRHVTDPMRGTGIPMRPATQSSRHLSIKVRARGGRSSRRRCTLRCRAHLVPGALVCRFWLESRETRVSKHSAENLESTPLDSLSTELQPLPHASDARPTRQRWTLVEQFECDGFHYRVSRRPIDVTVGPRLTTREKEVLRYAHCGYNNKLIASALGVAPSTVGVLLFRAASKIGARSRQELLRAYALLERKK